jgi:hypothetical protein
MTTKLQFLAEKFNKKSKKLTLLWSDQVR